MDYAVITEHVAQLLGVLALLVFTTNIVVEVLKIFLKRFPTSYLAVIVAMIVTLVAFFAIMCKTGTTIYWYYVAAAIVGGIFVAYIAMFGFDKFKEAWEHAHNYRHK